MTKEQIERRFAAIDALPPEELTPEEQQNLAKAQAMDDGSAVSLEQFQRSVKDYSGKLNIRIPRSLHRDLAQQAKADGVSLNQYILYKLAR